MNKKIGRGKILLAAYIILLIWILLFKFSISFSGIIDQFNNQSRSINLIPFHDSAIVNQTIDLSEIIYNILIFIPFGGLLGITYKQSSIFKKIVVIFVFSLCIEISQFIFGLGASDITDIITNVLGGIIGLAIYQLLRLIIRDEAKLDKVLIIIGSFILIVCLGFIIFLLVIN